MSGYDTEQLARLEPPYVARYGLKAAPFSSVHEDRFVYLDAERLQQLNMLHHLTQYSELLLIITGEKGIGKTSMLQRFIVNATEELVISQVEANPMMDANGLLQAIAEGYHLSNIPDDPSALQGMLYHHLADLHHKEQTPVLLVDDAHALPQDALETLFNLAEAEASDGNLLRIILFSDPQIETMLESPAIQGMRERVTHTMEIQALTAEQTVEYIRHRFLVAGMHGNIPLNAKELKKIYHNSNGIPARINECAHLILNGSSLEQAVKDFHVPSVRHFSLKQIVVVASVLLIATLMLLFQDKFNSLFEVESVSNDTRASTEQVTLPLVVPSTTPPTIPMDTAKQVSPLEIKDNKLTPIETAATAIQPSEKITKAPLIGELNKPGEISKPEDINKVIEATTETQLTQPEQNKEKLNESRAPKNKEADAIVASPAVDIKAEANKVAVPTLSIDTINPDSMVGSRKIQTIKIQGKGFTEKTVITVYWSGNKKKLPKKQFKFIDDANLEIDITVGTRADSWKVELSDPLTRQIVTKSFVVISASTKEAIDLGIENKYWIQKQNPQHFTLQLLGSYNKAGIIRFVKQHKLAQPIAWYETTRQGKSWHVLLQGNYKDKLAAKAAIKKSPTQYKRVKPWVRPFSQLQSGLKTVTAGVVKSKIVKTKTVKAKPVISKSVKMAPVIKATPPVTNVLSENPSWLWNQDPSHFTLQLMNGQNEDGIKRFINQNKLKGKAVYYRSQRNGQTRYIVLFVEKVSMKFEN